MGPDRQSSKRVVVGCVLTVVIAIAIWQAAAWVGSPDHPGAAPVAADPTAEGKEGRRTKPQKIVTAQAKPIQRKPSPPAETASASPTVEPSPTLGDVLHLPALAVAAPVQLLPETTSQTLDPPSDYRTVGLWPLGAQPGDERGTAIIAGHTVHTGGGALDDLELLAPDDEIVLERPSGDLTYRVTSVKIYRKATLAQDAASIFSQTVPARLAVVTCEDWNGSVYLSNVVVIAAPIY